MKWKEDHRGIEVINFQKSIDQSSNAWVFNLGNKAIKFIIASVQKI